MALGATDEVRVSFIGTSKMMNWTAGEGMMRVVGMTIDEATAKVRAKMNADHDEDLAVPVWAGVVPVNTVIGEWQPCPSNGPHAPRSGVEP